MKNNGPNDLRDDFENEETPPYVEVYYKNEILYRGFLIDIVIDDFDRESSHYAVSCINGELLCIPLYDHNWIVQHLGITEQTKPTPWELAKKEFGILCTERTAYEMLSLGFFSGFLIGFFGMFFLSWMIF